MPTFERTAATPMAVMDYKGFMRTVNQGESIQTYTILGDGWTKTSDEPYYAIGDDIGIFTAPAIAPDLLGVKYIEITALVEDLGVKANAETNPHEMPLEVGFPFIINNSNKVVDSLIFTGVGDVKVVGYER